MARDQTSCKTPRTQAPLPAGVCRAGLDTTHERRDNKQSIFTPMTPRCSRESPTPSHHTRPGEAAASLA